MSICSEVVALVVSRLFVGCFEDVLVFVACTCWCLSDRSEVVCVLVLRLFRGLSSGVRCRSYLQFALSVLSNVYFE